MQKSIITACATVALLTASLAPALGENALVTHERLGNKVLCPTNVQVELVPKPKAGAWSYDTSVSAVGFVKLDPDNLPRVEGGNLICYYAFGNQPGAFYYDRSEAGYTCVVNAQNNGFDCAPS
jgi:hypothetical protein